MLLLFIIVDVFVNEDQFCVPLLLLFGVMMTVRYEVSWSEVRVLRSEV